MLRTTALPAAALLGLTLLAPTAAQAVGETCQGQAATIVGAPGSLNLAGTEGRDVIVTNGAMLVSALGGDDLICVTGYGSQLYAGDGNDIVDATTLSQNGTQARLGAGSDRFEGSAAWDVVWAGTQATQGTVSEQQTDTEHDVILTGPAGSSIYTRDLVESGQNGVVNDDEIRMGSGILTWAGIPTATTVVDGGSGSSLVLKPEVTDSVAIDNVAATMTVNSQPALHFTGFNGFAVFAPQGPKAFTFRGGDRDESVSLELWDTARHTVSMGGGDDTLRFYSYEGIPSGTSYVGGPGRDTLDLTLPDEVDVDLDLARGRLSTGRKASEVTVRARGFEDSSVMAEDVEIIGTAGRNQLRVYACRSAVEGRGGRDKLSTFDEVMDEGLPCRRPRARFSGGGGNDVLTGSRGPDRLMGGPGRDRAAGREGRDVCEAEKRTSCEVRLRA